ncbi:MAG: nucleotidyltransferase family protein [Bacteroidota bacterium]
MKIDKEHIIEFLKGKKEYLQEKYGVTSISLFGSYARGEETEESDIDFFVEMQPDFFKRCELIEYLEKQFGHKVDVVRKHSNIRKRFLEELEKEALYV